MNNIDLTNRWKYQGILLGVFLTILTLGYYPTFSSIVSIWNRSETFAHGFIILPICIWLIWRIREQVFARLPQVNYLGIPLLILLGFIWLFANYIGILALEQLAATLMIPVLVFTLLGWQTTSVMIFPLLFIIFAVPLGEELTPFLINFTADFTVAIIKLTGIPVHREGSYFQLPTGSWSVVTACSGVRYLIASVTLGVLYAYLNYQTNLKRSLFVAASFILPIIANGLRAFMIVMIGHFSDMQLATGVDHLFYGWIFFGIVIAALFYIGSFWRDDNSNVKLRDVDWAIGTVKAGTPTYKMTILLACLVLIAWPVKLHFGQQKLDLDHVEEISIPAPNGWVMSPSITHIWKPNYNGLDQELLTSYMDKNGDKVTLFIGYYAQQRQGAEIGNYNNVLVTEKDTTWKAVHGNKILLPVANIRAPTAVIKSDSSQYLTTYFYYADGQWTSNKYQTKWLQAKANLFGRKNDGAIIAITTLQNEDNQSAVQILKSFSAASIDTIRKSLKNM